LSATVFYRILESPPVYSLAQKLLSPEAGFFLRMQFRGIFEPSEKMVLDIGCGPASALQLPKGIIVGADINPLYVRRYICGNPRDKKSSDGQARFGCVCSAGLLPFADNAFDETRCIGAFHHLDKGSVLSSIKEMTRCTRPGGRVIIFDSVWPRIAIYRPLAWLSCRFDRGRWMLREDELLGLAKGACPGDWQYRRFTYTFTGLEGLFLTLIKKAYKDD